MYQLHWMWFPIDWESKQMLQCRKDIGLDGGASRDKYIKYIQLKVMQQRLRFMFVAINTGQRLHFYTSRIFLRL